MAANVLDSVFTAKIINALRGNPVVSPDLGEVPAVTGWPGRLWETGLDDLVLTGLPGAAAVSGGLGRAELMSAWPCPFEAA